ncbi:MAG: HAD-IIB family hydrolase [Erysipelotrichaceae bacterium]|nr:HAD-IIB family hydrolase [Erysipelotrichaceae bacterium]
MPEKLPKPKLIVADIDGTMLNDERKMTARLRSVLIRAHEEGILLGLGSGRPVDMKIVGNYSEWGLPFAFDMIIGMNGGQLQDNHTGEIIDNGFLEVKYIREIFEFMKKYEDDLAVYVYEDGEMQVTRMDEMIRASSLRNEMKARIITREEIASKPRGKLMFRGEPKIIEEACEYARQFDCEHYHAFKTQPSMLEFQDPGCEKGKTLVLYCQRHGIDLKDVWAFGDMTNDNSMLKAAGLGICLKNGTDDTKACSDYITEYTNNEDGMAAFLEKHLFGIDEFLFEYEGYRVSKLNEHTYRLSENSAVSEYLFKGEKSGLLFDTGIAAGNIRKVVEKLMGTLPYIVVNSHGHDDHVAGDFQFEEIWCGREEERMIRELFTVPGKKDILYQEMHAYGGKGQSAEERLFFHTLEDRKAFEQAGLTFRIRPVEDGQIFDLGGLKLEAIKIGGHTPGQICLLDGKHRLLYVGDAVLRHVSILHVGGQKVSDFITGMEKLKARMKEFDFIISAHGHRQHGFRPLESEYILKMIKVAESIDVSKSMPKHEADGDGYEYYLDGRSYEDYDGVSIAYRLDCLDK